SPARRTRAPPGGSFGVLGIDRNPHSPPRRRRWQRSSAVSIPHYFTMSGVSCVYYSTLYLRTGSSTVLIIGAALVDRPIWPRGSCAMLIVDRSDVVGRFGGTASLQETLLPPDVGGSA